MGRLMTVAVAAMFAAHTAVLAQPTGAAVLAQPTGTAVLAQPTGAAVLAQPTGAAVLAHPTGAAVLTQPTGTAVLAQPTGIAVLAQPTGAAFLAHPIESVGGPHFPPTPPAAEGAAGLSLATSTAPATDDERHIHAVVLWFRFAGLVDTYVSARSDGEQLFLPMGELFSLLRIHCEIDGVTARGYFTADERSFQIAFDDGTAEIDGRLHHFTSAEIILEDGEVYVAPALLEAWFDLAFDLNVGEMSLSLRTVDDVPIVRMNRRSARRPELHDPYEVMRHAPLTYDRLRRLLGGGTLDYGLALSRSTGGTIVNADATVGAEVLGGDLRWRASAGHSGDPYVRQSEFLWRYVRDDERLSQVRVGTLYSTGLEPVAYHGIHLTNLPATPKSYFADYEVVGEAPPNWDVELYLDDRLVGFASADATGRYRFSIPIFYGTSMIRVQSYGPAGEERQELQRIQIPFNLLARGETRYNVHAGRARNSPRLMTQADVGYGINERVTVSAGVDASPRFEPIGSGPRSGRPVSQAPLPYVGVTSRIGTHFLAGVDVSPGGYTRASVQGFLPSHASLELQAVRFGSASSQMVDGRRHMLRAGGYLPFQVTGTPASLRLQLTRIAYDVGAEYSLGSFFYASARRVRLFLAARGTWGDGYDRLRISPTISYTVSSRDHDLLRHIDGMIVTARADYEVNPGRMERIHFDVGHNIRPRSRLNVTLDLGLNGMPSALGFRLSVDLPTARSTTSAVMRNHGSSIVQSIRGSAVHDEPNATVHFDRRPAVGRSSAAIRLFIDGDGNGRFDAGESTVDDDVVRLRNGSTGYTRRAGTVTLLTGLLPYVRYTASVDDAMLSNPMLVPAHTSFSFIADPNTVKPIDIPLTAAGVVEGKVMELRDGRSLPVAGATVRLIRRHDGAERVLKTYSDGTYYDMGIPPGTYDVHLDAEAHIDTHLAPSSHTVTIQSSVTGEIVEGLDFVLHRGGDIDRIQVGDATRGGGER